MTDPMPNADLADLRNMLERSNMVSGEIRGSFVTESTFTPLGTVDIDDLRALVARMDAARAKAIEECVKFVEADAWILRDGECSADDAGDVEARRTLRDKAEAIEELARLLRDNVKP